MICIVESLGHGKKSANEKKLKEGISWEQCNIVVWVFVANRRSAAYEILHAPL